jgi:hypothetical protein
MNPDILVQIYAIFKDFGVGVVEFGIIIFLIWKLGSNHIHHLGMKMDGVARDVKAIKLTVNDTNDKVSSLAERVSTLEGEMK